MVVLIGVQYWLEKPHTIFDNDSASESYGHWNEMLEFKHVKRLEEIRSGTAQPLSIRDWREKLRGHKEARELKSKRENVAKDFLMRRL